MNVKWKIEVLSYLKERKTLGQALECAPVTEQQCKFWGSGVGVAEDCVTLRRPVIGYRCFEAS
jgi:hypothetical protein